MDDTGSCECRTGMVMCALFKESLYEKVWGEEYDGDSRTLELHVQRLRKKMGWENQLVAVYKVGYRLEIA